MTGDSILAERPARPLPMWSDALPVCNPKCSFCELSADTDAAGCPTGITSKICNYNDEAEVVELECKPTLRGLRAVAEAATILEDAFYTNHAGLEMKWCNITGDREPSLRSLAAFARSVIGEDSDHADSPTVPTTS